MGTVGYMCKNETHFRCWVRGKLNISLLAVNAITNVTDKGKRYSNPIAGLDSPDVSMRLRLPDF